MTRVVHVVPRLLAGGAERLLVDICTRLDRSSFDHVVVSLTDRGPVTIPLEAVGVPVHAVGLHPSIPNPVAFARLVELLRKQRPDIVETWLYKADLVGGLASVIAGGPPLLWSVHQTELEPVGRLRSNVVTARTCARLSRWLPTLVLCVSDEVAQVHAAMGYSAHKLRVVPNGIDTDAFRPDPAARTRIRRELGIPENAPLVGLAARFDPQKDHATFANAARRISMSAPSVCFLLCGRDITWENAALVRLLEAAGLRDRVALLGVRDDMPAITAALDVAVSSSAFGEAFSVAISEAMASAVPCVATDSGNAVRLIGETGRVVSPRDDIALASGVIELLALPEQERRALGSTARRRIASDFSITKTAQRYAETYEEVVRIARAGR